jgi:cytochrome c-type biogenesis protein CcmH
MKALLRILLASVLIAVTLPMARAGEAASIAEDPVLEARVMALAEELRCLVCQNQTIADSHAGLAIDLKNQIREQLQAGRSNADVIAYMVARYGDFVLYRPPLKATTFGLWFGPFALLAGGIVSIAVILRRRRRALLQTNTATPEQRERAAALLADEPGARTS